MAAMEQHIRLAQSLPPRLLAFFKKFPPPQISTAAATTPTTPTIQAVSTTSSANPNEGAPTENSPSTLPSTTDPKRKINPFLPFRNPQTGNWHPPTYSLRRQAGLFKLAEQHSVLPLMPLSSKHPAVKAEKRAVRAEEPRRAKGKLRERTLRTRLEERRRAMEGMPEMIRLWKQRGHGRGWKKWPR